MADNPDNIAAFSSRGPCTDGRFKPDAVAPETAILSTRSSECEPEEGMGFNEFYMYLHGTSMATPLTAGAVAPIREHLRKVISDNSIFSADKGCPDSLGEPEGVQVFFCKYRDRICGTLSRDGVTWT